MRPTVFAKGNKRTVQNLIAMRKAAYAARAPRVALRIQGTILSIEKYGVSEVARMLHVHRSTVHSWITLWNEYGKDGLLEGHRSGRPPRLTQEDREQLRDIVESGPLAYGFNTGVWTSPIVAQVIEEEFQVDFHPGHVRKLLKAIGFPCNVRLRSWFRPTRKNKTSGSVTLLPT